MEEKTIEVPTAAMKAKQALTSENAIRVYCFLGGFAAGVGATMLWVADGAEAIVED